MKLIVDVAMLAVIAVLGFDMLFLLGDAISADSEMVQDFLEMDPSTLDLPIWARSVIAVTAVATWACVVLVFWPLHQVIRMKAFSFASVGRMLKRSAFGGIGFWFGSTLLFFVFPHFISWYWATENESAANVPLGFETIFFVMSLTFLSIGKTLERAEAVEEENSQFL
ncbi:hypothetical protein [Ruegeria sp.]|uniref:hypothetical protein n=1 Tax=Ruegeria sp. TaxID=1879320 RepID=UPI00232486B2|nr:hypothetical protein [Ruegeria sp.]MDA7966486.1 hypothetical protein [Ruegeria sp.]